MSHLKRFNLGFSIIGPREYCTSGRYVEADEATRRELLLEEGLKGSSEMCEHWHQEALNQDKENRELRQELRELKALLAYQTSRARRFTLAFNSLVIMIGAAVSLWVVERL
jgi:hypothetical protein